MVDKNFIPQRYLKSFDSLNSKTRNSKFKNEKFKTRNLKHEFSLHSMFLFPSSGKFKT
jgi:hypothetical protein